MIRLLPLTRAHKLGYQTAHGEGWALYAERLMGELDLKRWHADALALGALGLRDLEAELTRCGARP